MIAALFVETNGCYYNHPHIDPWDIQRNAKKYKGPWKIIAHPQCQRWGRYWHGSPIKPHQYKLGADDGCFAAALMWVRRWGGVIEHPCDSHAWSFFKMIRPKRGVGWTMPDIHGGRSCYVEQGHYGHFSRKP